MSQLIDREFVAQAVIVLALCFGGWMLFVQPKVEQIYEIEEIIRQHPSGGAPLNPATIERLARPAATLQARSHEIESKGELARNSAKLYSKIMRPAAENGVKVQNLQPGVRPRINRDSAVEVVRINVKAEGEYEHIASFLNALDDIDGYLRSWSLRLSPTQRDGRSPVAIQLGCEALSFQLPEAVQQVMGADDDDT